MSFARKLLSTLALTAILATPALAQDHSLTLFGRSGGFNSLTNLNNAGTMDFKQVGYTVGGGAAAEVQRYVSIRGDFTYARNPFRVNQINHTGPDVARYFYDAAIQLQYPTSVGLEPYLFVGGGAVTIRQVGVSGQDKTKGTGTAGLGLNYTIPRIGLGFFAEGKSWLYNPTDLTGILAGIDKLQYEISWTGGASYRFRF